MIPPHEDDAQSLLILAGDTSSQIHQLCIFIEEVSKRFLHVFVVPGNHEYYGHIRQHQEAVVRLRLSPLENVTYSGLGTSLIEFEDFAVVGNTLWGEGARNTEELHTVNRYLRDVYVIYDELELTSAPYVGKKLFSVDQMRQDNLEFRKQFVDACNKANPNKKLIGVTHHLPFYELCHPRFGGGMDAAFACDFSEILKEENRKPDVWAFGHTHDTIDRVFNGIQFYCNPRGYKHEQSEKNIYNQYGYLTIGNNL